VVRAATGIHLKETYLTYNAEPDRALAVVREVIEGAIESGVYVIIDFHSHELELELALRFFDEMSANYGQYPHVIYEIFNEPVHQSWEEVKAYSEKVIATIRANDPDNLILVGSPHWAQDLHLVAADPIIGQENLMYTLHYYAASHGQELRDRADAAIASGIPVFISESAGMSASGDGPIDLEAWQAWQDWGEKQQLSWITWSISDKNESCSFLFRSASGNGGWKLNDLTGSGLLTRAILRRHAGLE
jgi:endoglucanase